ncbi:hypothetical protein P378_10765 [Desulforamulus profundi]|uniref:Exostosin GT47 domain-containing protein n=1 Tax=Desulforamulus profundi TaxID=1383067 RepID=A0A2C6MFZ4_9FIRM|nr:exostosin family protein [Desulforamulus profundi]PHJ38306.1 hypothetical protein P378_10765 [Desulforamulus profundi]
MKIYILPVPKKLQPAAQVFKYPRHNKDYGVEQDFYHYLLINRDLTVENPRLADWHYLPVFWTRWHLNHLYGKICLAELQQEMDQAILDDAKTFTICQYDDGPLVNPGRASVFLASRKSEEGIDIPLLCSPHQAPPVKPQKRYLASFVGRLATHGIRQQMAQVLKDREDVFVFDGNLGSGFFVEKLQESYIGLCPRGYGGSSFRFFETMQLGAVPFLIGDLDTRPFKRFIDWDGMSLYTNSVADLHAILDSMKPAELVEMGEWAGSFWENELTYQRWCKYVLKELVSLK